ncbi:MAG: DUF3618 domain-containing protein [Nitrospirales bacterium]
MDDQRTHVNTSGSGKIEDPDRLRDHIRVTRAELDETVHTLRQRLSPETIKAQVQTAAKDKIDTAKEKARVKVTQWQSLLTERVRDRPVPAALIGVGVMWMMKQAASSSSERSRFRRNRYDYDYTLDPHEDWPDYAPESKAGRRPHQRRRPESSWDVMKAKAEASGQQAREQISEWTGQAQESLEDWKSKASHRSEEIRERTRERGEHMKGELYRVMHESPLTMGAMTLAIGTAIGLSLPRSEKENQWMGETRDRWLEEAKATAKEIAPKAKEAAAEVQRAAGEAGKTQAEMR